MAKQLSLPFWVEWPSAKPAEPDDVRKKLPRNYQLCMPAPPGSGPVGETCGTCKFSVSVLGGNKSYRKCRQMEEEWTRGPGSDIKQRYPACRAWLTSEKEQQKLLELAKEARAVWVGIDWKNRTEVGIAGDWFEQHGFERHANLCHWWATKDTTRESAPRPGGAATAEGSGDVPGPSAAKT